MGPSVLIHHPGHNAKVRIKLTIFFIGLLDPLQTHLELFLPLFTQLSSKSSKTPETLEQWSLFERRDHPSVQYFRLRNILLN